MIKTERTKLYEGNIDVPEQYVKEAAKQKVGLELTHKGKIMILSFLELTTKCLKRQYYTPKQKQANGKPKEGYYLYIYKWKPNK